MDMSLPTLPPLTRRGVHFWTPALAALVPGGIAQELAQQQAEGPYKTSLPYTPLHRSE